MATYRTSEQVWHQVSWDPRLDPALFVLGVDVHGGEPARVRLPEFVPGGDIPWHRVLFVEADGVRCWDRAGLDTIDDLARSGRVAPRLLRGPAWEARAPHRWDGVAWRPTGAARSDVASGSVLRVLTWNVLWDRFDAELLRSEERWPRIVDEVLASDADLVALQEVRAPLHARFLADPRVRERWWLSHGPGHADIGRADLLLLARAPLREVAVCALGPHKAALGAVVRVGDRAVVVVTTHLTSDHAPRAAPTRARELASISAALAGVDEPKVLLGDLNLADEGPVDGWTDAWTALQAPAPTFDPSENPLAALSSLSGRAARLDRVLLAGDVVPVHAALIGRSSDPGLGHPSDHWGVAAALRFGADPERFAGPTTRRSAIAWVPAGPDAAAVEALRAARDPEGHARWPAHVNVIWPAPREADLGAAAPAIAAAITGATPFPSRWAQIDTFPGRSPVHHVRPDDAEPWRALHQRLCAHLPAAASESAAYAPHLTLARGGAPPEPVPPIEGRVDRLALLTRRGESPFAVRAWLALGSADPIAWVAEAPCSDGPAPDPVPWVEAVAGAVGERGAVALVGSAALGTALSGADVDLLVLAPTHDPGAVRRRLVDALAPDAAVLVRKVGLDGLRLRVDGRSVDLVFVPLGDVPVAAALDAEAPPPAGLSAAAARAVGAVRDLAALRARTAGQEQAFAALCRWAKAWARARGLDDPALGGVEGLAWAVLAADALPPVPPAAATALDDDVARFVARWASWDLRRGVGGPDWVPSPSDPRWGLPVYTPSAPSRPITRRVDRVRFEAALVGAWEAVEAGASAADLRRPGPWHREHADAVLVVAADDAGFGVARGRGMHLVAALPHPVAPLRVPHGFALGLPRGADLAVADAVLDGWSRHPELVAAGVRASRVPTERIGA